MDELTPLEIEPQGDEPAEPVDEPIVEPILLCSSCGSFIIENARAPGKLKATEGLCSSCFRKQNEIEVQTVGVRGVAKIRKEFVNPNDGGVFKRELFGRRR